MEHFSINHEYIVLPLTKHKSKIRIADNEGNHITKTTSCIINENMHVEWMITNNEINELILTFLDNNKRVSLINEVNNIGSFIKNTEYVKREANKGALLTKFNHFDVFEHIETFYSFETILPNGIKMRVAVKMGDFTLNPFFFVLIPFMHDTLIIKNHNNENLGLNETLGSGAYGLWSLNSEIVKEIIRTIAFTSTDHKNDMIRMLTF